MRHVIAGSVLLFVALAVTFGVATVLRDMAMARNPSRTDYAPPSIASPGGKAKPTDRARVFMMSRRMNDE